MTTLRTALERLHTVCATMDCEIEGDRPSEAEYQKAMADAERLLREDAAQPAPTADRVPMPTNAEQAEAMQKLGLAWLTQHAPERLQPAPAARPMPEAKALEIAGRVSTCVEAIRETEKFHRIGQPTTPAVPEVDMVKFDALTKKHARALYTGSQQEWDVAEFNRAGLLMFADALLASAPTSTSTDGGVK